MTYIDFFCETPRISQRLTDIKAPQRTLYIDCRHERTRLRPSDVLAREGYIDGAYDVVVLRGAEGFSEVVEEDRALIDRCPPCTLIVESSRDSTHRAPHIRSPSWAEGRSPFTPEALREIELWGLVLGRGALLGADGEHFEVRSGFHLQQYLRIRDAIDNPLDAERIADWLLEYVEERTTVLADRPNLGMLLQAIALQCQKRFDWDVDVAPLEPFPRDKRTSAQTMWELDQHADHVLLVLGVDHAAFQEAKLSMLSTAETTAVCLVDITPDQPTSSVAFRHHPIARWPQNPHGHCSECKTYSRLLRVDVRKEEIFQESGRRPIRVLRRHYEPLASFWRAVDETNALRIHASVEYDDGMRKQFRHRPIHIDMRRLLTDFWFRRMCRSTLKALERPDRIIVPFHEVTDTLRNILAEAFDDIEDLESIISVVPRGGLTDELRRDLPESHRILFVDDALVTGQTLQGMIDSIQAALSGSQGTHEVSAFVALCCPPSPARMEELQQHMASFGNPGEPGKRLHYGKRVYLPDSGSCAFCEEQRWLRQLQRFADAHRALVGARLAQLEAPITDETLLFRPPSDTAQPAPIPVGDRNLSPSATYAAFASAAQHVRSEMRAPDGAVRRFLDTGHAISRYPSAPKLSGILRTFTEHEVNYSVGTDLPVKGMLAATGTLTARGLAEIGWAAVTDKLPVVHAEYVDAAMESAATDPVIALLRQLLAQRSAR